MSRSSGTRPPPHPDCTCKQLKHGRIGRVGETTSRTDELPSARPRRSAARFSDGAAVPLQPTYSIAQALSVDRSKSYHLLAGMDSTVLPFHFQCPATSAAPPQTSRPRLVCAAARAGWSSRGMGNQTYRNLTLTSEGVRESYGLVVLLKT